MIKKVLVTGGKGFLGSRFEKMFKDKYELLMASVNDLDVTKKENVDSVFDSFKPDYVIHAAGIPNQQFCIEHPELAHAVNVDGAVYVAEACKRVGAKLVFISTEQVFNGSNEPGPYKEEDTPIPDTVYGENKLECERLLKDILNEYWVVRFTWLFGLPERGCAIGSNILWDTIQSIIKNQPIKVSEYEFRGMSNVNEICENLERLWSLPYGTYHFGSVNNNGRYEIVRHIMKELGLSDERISQLLIADNSKYNVDHIRELRLDVSKSANLGLKFTPTKVSITKCLKEFSIIK